MATVTRERREGGNWKDTDRRVRHPLQTVRRYIRRYVILEGLGLSLLYLSIAFWLGFLFDWGMFQALGLDWIESFQNVTMNSSVEFYVRGLILTVVVLGLCAVAVSKTLFRLFREFSDHAMALLLERRFPRQLGDRLMTAVELANPNKSERYGFSLPLTEKTIRDAAERVERVPVSRVFNWARLRWIYAFDLLLTVGLFGLIGAVTCLARWEGPGDFLVRSTDVGGIWAERNLMLRNIHWPRDAYLEVLGFEPSVTDKNSMRVGSGEQRSDLRVRALKWIKGDRSVSGGWSPMLWQDLDGLIEVEKSRGSTVLKDLVEQVKLENPWDGWVLDNDEKAGDWREWTLDQIWRQSENKDVRARMSDVHFNTQPEIAFLGVRLDETKLSLPGAAVSGVGLTAAAPPGGAFLAWPGPNYTTGIEGVSGAWIKGVVAGSPAEMAGLKVGDRITAVGDQLVGDAETLRRAIRAGQDAKKLAVSVKRGDSELVLEAGNVRDSSALGLTLENVEKATPAGAKITGGVVKGGPADNAGFQVGNIVVEARGQPVADAKALGALLQAKDLPKQIAFKVQRRDRLETLYLDAAALGQKLFDTADMVNVAKLGARITAVAPGSLAEKADLKKGDLIVKAAGREVLDEESLLSTAKSQNAGEFAVEVLRDEKSVTCNVELTKLPLELIFDRLSQLAAEPGMLRYVTEKKIPEKVTVYWTDKSANFKDEKMGANYSYKIGLGSPPQTTVFRVRGLDYYTPYRTIVVAPPPSLATLTADRFEPAYFYYRLEGDDQRPLKGVTRDCLLDELAVTGISLVRVPAGSKVVLRAALDTSEGRKIGDVALRAVKRKDRPDGEAEDTAAVPKAKAVVSADKTSFTLELKNVDTTYDFIIEFRDEDRAVGQRRVRIEVQPDEPPQVALGIESEMYMRRPRMRGKDPGDLPPLAGDSWLITTNAVVPLKGLLKDDFGLTEGNYVLNLEPYNFEFFTVPKSETDRIEPGKDKAKEKDKKLPVALGKKFVVSMPLRQYLPSFIEWQRSQITVTRDEIDRFNELDAELMGVFRRRNYPDAIPLAEKLYVSRKKKLGDHPDVARTLRLLGEMYEAQGDKAEARRRFDEADAIAKQRQAVEVPIGGKKDDFKLADLIVLLEDMKIEDARLLLEKKIDRARDLPRLPTFDAPVKLHHTMQLFIEATDNNVETGPTTARTRTPIRFIIVSETEFLAQVGEEEEVLNKRLDDAIRGLERSRDRLTELNDALTNAAAGSGSVAANYEHISTRYARAQRMLLDASSLTREISKDYDRIEQQLLFNKGSFGAMHKKHQKVSEKIALPLRNLVQGNPITGVDFPSTETLLKKRIDFAEDQRAAGNDKFLPAQTARLHAQEAIEVRKKVLDLLGEMNAIGAQIQEEVKLQQIIDTIRSLRDEEEKRAKEWKRLHEEKVKEEIDLITK